MLEHGANPNAKNQPGRTPLHITMGDDHGITNYEVNVDSARLLLEYGADPDAGNSSGATALHSAAAQQRPDAVQLLFAYGAVAKSRQRCPG